MVCIRQATSDDLLQMQTTNLWCLPENYQVSGVRAEDHTRTKGLSLSRPSKPIG